jgi:hypothetical protein
VSRDTITPADASARALGTLLAALAPLLAALSNSSGFGPASGGPHVLHAALALSCAEPPGHPLSVLVLRAAAFVPIGPLALRVELATAALLSLAAAALYRALDTGLRATGVLRSRMASPLALGLCLLAFGAGPLFTREPQPHAAALALACLGLACWVAFECAWPRLELSALRAGSLLLGLLLAEQPALALLLLLFALPVVRRVLREYRLPAWNLAPLALGLPLLLYAPLARAPELGLSCARTPLEQVRTAFALAVGLPPQGAAFRPAEIAALSLVALGALGATLSLRAPATRKLGVSWLALGLGAFAASRWLAHGDAASALALYAAAALAGFALAPVLSDDGQGRLAPALAAMLVLLGLGLLHAGARAARGVDPTASDALADPLRRQLPARSALLLAPELAAALLDAEAEERTRPDLLVALAPWQLDLRAAERIAARSPELLPLLRAQLLARAPPPRPPGAGNRDADGARALPLVELAGLAGRRPTLIELSPELDPALHAVLLPHALYHQVSTHGIGKTDVELAARGSERQLARLYDELDVGRLDRAARALLADRHTAEVAYARSVGDVQLEARARQRIAALQAQHATREQR